MDIKTKKYIFVTLLFDPHFSAFILNYDANQRKKASLLFPYTFPTPSLGLPYTFFTIFFPSFFHVLELSVAYHNR